MFTGSPAGTEINLRSEFFHLMFTQLRATSGGQSVSLMGGTVGEGESCERVGDSALSLQ